MYQNTAPMSLGFPPTVKNLATLAISDLSPSSSLQATLRKTSYRLPSHALEEYLNEHATRYTSQNTQISKPVSETHVAADRSSSHTSDTVLENGLQS